MQTITGFKSGFPKIGHNRNLGTNSCKGQRKEGGNDK